LARVLHWTGMRPCPERGSHPRGGLTAKTCGRVLLPQPAAASFDSEHTTCRLACRVWKSKYTSLRATSLGAGLLCNPDCTGGHYGKYPATALRYLRHARGLETCKFDENGKAVHEDCYVGRMLEGRLP
jgi:hypothetical protein